MRTIATALFILMVASATASAQDRGVSIPDVFTPDSADDFVAREVTTALRVAASMTPDWRLSTTDIPFAELMRACGGSLESDPDLGCAARMVVTRDPSMGGGRVLFVVMERVGDANGFRITILLYDMREERIMGRIRAPVARIMAPAARNREAAEWIRQLVASRVEVAETRPADPVTEAVADQDPVATEVTEPDVPPDRTPVAPYRPATDFAATETIGLVLIGAAVASAIAAGITGGLLLAMNDDERFIAYRRSWDATHVPDVCREAANDPSPDGEYAVGVCNDAGTFEIASPVLWTLAGALAVGGAAVLLMPRLLDSSNASPEVALVPVVGSTFAGVELLGTF